MDHDELDMQLDVLLRARAVPEMRSNLAYRIIEASLNTNSPSSHEFVVLRSRRAQVGHYVPRGSPWTPAHALNAKWYYKRGKTGGAKILALAKGAGGALLKGVAGVLDHVALPQPAFAMAVVVVMIGGTVLGLHSGGLGSATFLSNDESGYTSTYDSSDVETYIMATDSFEYGDFL